MIAFLTGCLLGFVVGAVASTIASGLAFIFVIAPLRGWWPWGSKEPLPPASPPEAEVEAPGAEQEGDSADS